MRSLDQRLSELLLDIYESAARPEHWEVVLDKLAREVGATKASMHAHRFTGLGGAKHIAGTRLHSYGYDLSTAVAYAKEYSKQDPYVHRIRVRFPGRSAGTSEQLITSSELRKTAFYSEYGRPNGLFHVSWTVVEENARFASGLAVIRPERAKQFGQEHVRLLRLLTPHLEKAFRLERAFEKQVAKEAALMLSISQFDLAVVALDEERKIVQCSKPALGLLEQRDALLQVADRLKARDDVDDRLLQKSFMTTAKAWDDIQAPCTGSVPLKGKTGEVILQVVVFPIPSSDASGSLLGADRPKLLVFLSTPNREPSSRAALLRALYGVTATEARVADLLLKGLAPKQAAKVLGSTEQTARFHLKQVFVKTRTHSQAELIRLLLCLPSDQLQVM